MTEEALRTLRGDRYRLHGVLGEGGQATTFDAIDTASGRAVAVKRFRVRGARSWKDVELAEREAAVLAGLDHPQIPRYVEHFEEGGDLFLVTEKIEGESLASLRRRGVVFDEAEVRRFLRDAATVLRYLHGRTPPVVHRDLKPSNILRRPDGSFAFLDFRRGARPAEARGREHGGRHLRLHGARAVPGPGDAGVRRLRHRRDRARAPHRARAGGPAAPRPRHRRARGARRDPRASQAGGGARADARPRARRARVARPAALAATGAVEAAPARRTTRR